MTITVAQFVTHAEKFGVEEVHETAFEVWGKELRGLREQLPPPEDIAWMAPAARDRLLDDRERAFREYRAEFEDRRQEVADRLLRLRVALDAIQASRTLYRRRRSRDETAMAVRLLADEGLIGTEIGEKLGISAAHVQRVLSSPRPPVSTPSYAGGLSVRNGKPRAVVAGAVS